MRGCGGITGDRDSGCGGVRGGCGGRRRPPYPSAEIMLAKKDKGGSEKGVMKEMEGEMESEKEAEKE